MAMLSTPELLTLAVAALVILGLVLLVTVASGGKVEIDIGDIKL